MDREVSIVLSREKRNYRKVAQEWYGLTDEQMTGMDVHHNPPLHKGGRNIPEHLFVYHPTLHTAVHEFEFVKWSRVGGQKAHELRNENGKSIHGIRVASIIHPIIHSQKDENGKSEHAVKMGKSAHKEKDEKGKSLHGLRCANLLHAKKDERGKSVASVKGGSKGGKVGSANTNSQKYKCLVTGKISTPGPLTRWQRKRNIDTSLRVRVS